MIVFNSEINFDLDNSTKIETWILHVIQSEGFEIGEINYIFCSDDYLLQKNIKFLNHNTLTDIISFDYSLGKLISGDIFISIDRIKENSETYNTSFINELHRVIIHGILHYCGYDDKSSEEKLLMRQKEDYYLSQV